jgi:hypothetical protein
MRIRRHLATFGFITVLFCSTAVFNHAVVKKAESGRKPQAPPRTAPQSPDSGQTIFEIRKDANFSSAALAKSGLAVIEDYGSFVVARGQASGAEALRSQGLDVQADGRAGHIRVGSYLTGARHGEPVLPPDLHISAYASGQKGLYLVQFHGPIKGEWVEGLQARGIEVVRYVPANAYLVRSAQDLRENLKNEISQVEWVGLFQPAYKLCGGLQIDESADMDLMVHVLDGPTAGEVISMIEAESRRVIMENYHILNKTILRRRIPGALAAELAMRPEVIAIEPWFEPVLMDEVQDQILAGNYAGAGPTGPGYDAWLTANGFGDVRSVIVDIADDGFDTGNLGTGMHHPDFDAPFGSSRAAYAFFYTPDGPWGMGGHGTINQSIVGGHGLGTGMLDPNGYLYGEGVCPTCTTGQSKIFADCGGFTATPLTTIVSNAYGAGARITSNSWGWTPGDGGYNADSQTYDVLARDANANPGDGLQEMIVIFAAGNSGNFPNTVSSPSTAKNVVSVGATENFRMNGADGCGIPDSDADNLNDVVWFSGRGPVDDGRLKPDVGGPGTHVQGAASQYGFYNGCSVCDQYWPGAQTMYARSSGTSHSTPAVAGGSALVYYRYNAQVGAPPSPAMLKAILVATADDMVGGNDGAGGFLGNKPDDIQGWGRVNLGTAADNAAKLAFDQQFLFTATGQTNNPAPIFVTVDPARPIKIVLTWSDAPGDPLIPGGGLNNNLDLVVTMGPNTYLGNNFGAGGWSVTGGAADGVNNVESVFLPPMPVSPFTVTINAANINSDGVPGNGSPMDQDFAVFIYNATDQTSDGLITLDRSVYNCGGGACGMINVTVSDADLQGAGTQAVTVASTTENAPPESLVLVETGPGTGVFTGTIFTAGGAPVPDGWLQVSPGDTITATYIDADDGMGGINVPKTANAGVDCTGPVFSNVQVQNITDDSALITWDTNEPSSSGVTYDTMTPPMAFLATNPALVTNHSVLLTGLSSCTRYYFFVASADAACNGSADTNGGAYYTFVTPGLAPLFFDDMESGVNGWTSGGLWHQVSDPTCGPASYSATRSWYYGQDSVCTFNTGATTAGNLDSPVINNLPAGASLSFWFRQQTECFGSCCGWDACTVLVSGNGGPFVQVAQICDDSNAWVFSGPIDLTPYYVPGDDIQLRFRFDSGDDFLNDYLGWMVDDVLVEAASYSGCPGFGTITLDRPFYGCADTIFITVTDSDLNANPGAQETTTVNIASTTEPAGENVLLFENGLDSSDFLGSMFTGPGAPSPDGWLQVSPGDTITATYIDADDGMGGINVPKTATAGVDCVPVVGYDSHVASDCGNFDGVVDQGETVSLSVTVQNTGVEGAYNVTGVLSTVTPGITVTIPGAAFPDIPGGGGFGTSLTPFEFTVGPAVPCGTMIDFSLMLNYQNSVGAPFGNTVNFQVQVGGGLAGGMPTNVAIFENGPNWWGPTAITDILTANTIPYTVYSGADMGVVDLSPFDKVVLNSNQDAAFYASVVANKAWFEAWASAGGVLEMHLAHNENTDALVFPGDFSNLQAYSDGVSIVAPAHPIVTSPNAITDAELDFWNSSTHSFIDMSPGGAATILVDADLNPGQPVVQEALLGSGAVVVSTQTLEWAWANGYSTILENFLLYMPVTLTCNPAVCGQPFLQYDSHAAVGCDLDPDVEPGESVDMSVTVRNISPFDAFNVTGTLSTATPGVTVTTANAAFPNITGSGGTGASLTDFRFMVDPSVPCGTVINFDLLLNYEDNGGTPYSNVTSFTVQVAAPCVVTFCQPYMAYDSQVAVDCGNADGVVDPGETIDLWATVQNVGSQDAFNVAGMLSTSTPGITITAANAAFPNVPSGGFGTSLTNFQFIVDGAVPCGTMINFNLLLNYEDGLGAPFSNTVNFQVQVGSGSPTVYAVNPTPFGWVDTSGGTSLMPALFCDDCTVNIPIGFSFDFYGAFYTDLFVSSNGIISFGLADASFSNACLPSGWMPPMIAPWWDDLYPPNGGDIRYLLQGAPGSRTLTVSWENVPHINVGGNTLSFQVTLYEGTNNIVVQYLDTVTGSAFSNNGAGATAGVEAGDGINATQFSCFTASLFDNMALLYNRGVCNPAVCAAPPAEPSATDIGPVPPLLVADPPGTLITAQEVPAAAQYVVYGGPIGLWYNDPAGCAAPWISLGGLVQLAFPIPDNAWITLAARNASGESSAGRNSLGGERKNAGTWTFTGPCP